MRILVSLLLLAFSATAFAQEDRNVKYNQRTEIDFEALDVSGEMVKPQGSLLMERTKTKFPPVIQPRYEFNAEMTQSVNEIK